MKKLFYIGLLALALYSCSKEEVDTTPKEVEVKLDYAFTESGSMTRAGADVYGTFYNTYIKTKKLTPKTYFLTFKDKTSNYKTLEVSGTWSDNTSVRLPSGTYSVTGKSFPIIENYENVPSDTVYIKFSEDITIKEGMTELILNAQYDSYLLLFDKENTNSINYTSVFEGSANVSKYQTLPLESDDKVYWTFITTPSYYYTDIVANSKIPYENYQFDINRKDNTKVVIFFDGLKFSKGKYYYFNDMTNSFDIPPMESGN